MLLLLFSNRSYPFAGVVSQAPASLAGTLDTRDQVVGTVSQSAATLAGTLNVTTPVRDVGAKPDRRRRGRIIIPPPPILPTVLTGAVIQAPAMFAGSLVVSESEDWLLGLFRSEEDLILA